MKNSEQSIEAEILHEILRQEDFARQTFDAQIGEIKKNLNNELFPSIKRSYKAILDAQRDKKIDEEKAKELKEKVIALSLDVIGIDVRRIPEYYFEIEEDIKLSQQVFDWIYGEDRFDLQQSIVEKGEIRFPYPEERAVIRPQGFTQLLIHEGDIKRGEFLDNFGASFRAEFGHGWFEPDSLSLIPTDNIDITDTFDGRNRGPKWNSIMFNPTTSVQNDRILKKTVGEKPHDIREWESEKNDEHGPFGKKVPNWRGGCDCFQLEEYLSAQMLMYFKGGRDPEAMFDKENPTHLTGEVFKVNNVACSLYIKWDSKKCHFVIGGTRMDRGIRNVGARIKYSF